MVTRDVICRGSDSMANLDTRCTAAKPVSKKTCAATAACVTYRWEASRRTPHSSRLTPHASRLTPHVTDADVNVYGQLERPFRGLSDSMRCSRVDGGAHNEVHR
jgi:hypothetical protein